MSDTTLSNGMSIEEFIEKAIKGGWKAGEQVNIQTYATKTPSVSIGDPTDPKEFMQTATILLDPLTWQAVGKVEGWNSHTEYGVDTLTTQQEEIAEMPTWKLYMHRLIDALAEGKSIEGYLSTL